MTDWLCSALTGSAELVVGRLLRSFAVRATFRRMPRPDPRIKKWQAAFVAALPKMRTVLDFRLRHLRGNRRDEAEADSLGLAWQDWLSLCKRGIDPTPWANKIAQFAALGATSDKSQLVNDLLSRSNRHLVKTIHESEDSVLPPEVANLADNREPSPADQAQANIDVETWLEGLNDRERLAAGKFASGKSNTQVGNLLGLGRGTGSSIRCKLRESWSRFNR